MTLAWCAVFWLASTIEQARQLAYQKQFGAAESLYREALRNDPNSRDARFGLAQVLLWEGHYPEARRMFRALGDAEGAATAAYWQGDFRTAAREFAALDTPFARRSLSDIRAATAGDDRIIIEGFDDNQPFRAWRSSVTASMFSDPLTRWDVTAGGYGMHNVDRRTRRSEPFVSATNAYVLPWQRLTITSTLGALKFPDGSTRPIGGIAITRKLASSASVTIEAQHRELLANATAIDTHPSVTTYSANWTRYVEHGWIAGFETGRHRYFDRNNGSYVQGYGLWPVSNGVRVGFSAAVRDTDRTTFGLDAVSATRTGDFFTYGYRGSYRGYWAPVDFREARAIVSLQHHAGRADLKAQGEVGVGRDEARAFGPSSGLSQLPSDIFSFDFRRTFHPYRIAAGVALPIAAAYRLQVDLERNVTVFYAANAFRASLVRHR